MSLESELEWPEIICQPAHTVQYIQLVTHAKDALLKLTSLMYLPMVATMCVYNKRQFCDFKVRTNMSQKCQCQLMSWGSHSSEYADCIMECDTIQSGRQKHFIGMCYPHLQSVLN